VEINGFVIVLDLFEFVPHPADYPYLREPWFLVMAAGVILASGRTVSPVYTCVLTVLGAIGGYWVAGGVFMAGWFEHLFEACSIQTAEEAGGYASLAGLLLVNLLAHTRQLHAPHVVDGFLDRPMYDHYELLRTDDVPEFLDSNPWSD